MRRQDEILQQLNQLLLLLGLHFRFEEVNQAPDGSYMFLIEYEQEEKRKYVLKCQRGLALRRIYPQF